MKFRIFGVEFTFSFWFFAVAALFAVCENGALIQYLALPVAVHELGHLLAMWIVGVKPKAVIFRAVGVQIQRGPALSPGFWSETLIFLAGPLMNGLLAGWLYFTRFQSMRVMLLVAVNVALCAFNLLPIGSLDGGELARLLADRLFEPRTAYVLSLAASFAALVPLFAAAIFLLLKRENFSLLLLCVYLAAVVIARE